MLSTSGFIPVSFAVALANSRGTETFEPARIPSPPSVGSNPIQAQTISTPAQQPRQSCLLLIERWPPPATRAPNLLRPHQYVPYRVSFNPPNHCGCLTLSWLLAVQFPLQLAPRQRRIMLQIFPNQSPSRALHRSFFLACESLRQSKSRQRGSSRARGNHRDTLHLPH